MPPRSLDSRRPHASRKPARFYAPGDYVKGGEVQLPEEEAQHATRVMRLGVGASVTVFDGRGRAFKAQVSAADKTRVTVAIGSPIRPAAEPHVEITLVQAVLKGDSMDEAVRDAVMMGVAAVQPVVTTRSETSLIALERAAKRERWQRVAIASTKQCGRGVLPRILEPLLLPKTLVPVPPAGAAILCVEPEAAETKGVASLPVRPPRTARVFIGPEGGWTPEEVARISGIASPITLGARTLRAESMGLVALTALFTYWKEL